MHVKSTDKKDKDLSPEDLNPVLGHILRKSPYDVFVEAFLAEPTGLMELNKNKKRKKKI